MCFPCCTCSQEEKPETTVLLDAIADAMSDADAGLRSFGAKCVFARDFPTLSLIKRSLFTHWLAGVWQSF
jgi:hypothetical protein